jgi:hypothetical protein
LNLPESEQPNRQWLGAKDSRETVGFFDNASASAHREHLVIEPNRASLAIDWVDLRK